MPDNNNAPRPAPKAPAAANAEAQARTGLLKDIKTLAGALAKANESIHNLGIRCMVHCQNYGDVANSAARLVDAMPKSYRRDLVINWFAAFTPIELGKDKDGNIKGHLRGKADERVWNIEAARATPFYAMPEAEREQNVPTYESIHDNVIAFVKRMKTQAEKIADEQEKAKAIAEIDKIGKVVKAVAA